MWNFLNPLNIIDFSLYAFFSQAYSCLPRASACSFSLSLSLIFCIIGASVYNIAQNCSKGEDTPFSSQHTESSDAETKGSQEGRQAGGWPCCCKDPTITRSSSVIKHLATAAARVPVLTGRSFWEESAVAGWGL